MTVRIRVMVRETREAIVEIDVPGEKVIAALAGARHSAPEALLAGRQVEWSAPRYEVVDASV